MKLATLLAQYLYSNHRLDLPGIGTFLLDPSTLNAAENSKQRTTLLEGITFESNPSLKESPDLIAFISTQSGKMKALAQADLGSHLQLAQQFLNISKPFTFEGIGTLTTLKPGEYQFTPAAVSPDKLKETKTKEAKAVIKEEPVAEYQYESFLSKAPAKTSWRKPVAIIFIIAGIGAAIGGGYWFSKKSGDTSIVTPEPETPQPTTTTTPVSVQPEPLQQDTQAIKVADTTLQQINITPADSYKYVLEIANSKRAFERFYRLKAYQWQVQMETQDSIKYKLFLVLPSQNADTTHILDSLTVMNGKKVYIEYQN